jgi:hypothetical protein
MDGDGSLVSANEDRAAAKLAEGRAACIVTACRPPAVSSGRENDRDVTIRRLQNDAALWRKHVETEELKEKNDGTTQNEPAEERADA